MPLSHKEIVAVRRFADVLLELIAALEEGMVQRRGEERAK